MIKSETNHGLIYAGSTSLDFTCAIEQIAPATLSVSSGHLTLTNGETFAVPALSAALPDGSTHLYLGLLAGTPALAVASPMGHFDQWFTPLQMIAGFGSGIQVSDGEIVGDVYVLTVLPGFPEGAAPGPGGQPLPKWTRLKEALRGSMLFNIAYQTADDKAFSLLLSVLDSNEAANSAGRLASLQTAITLVRAGLAVDYTPEQVSEFNELLAGCDFALQIQ